MPRTKEERITYRIESAKLAVLKSIAPKGKVSKALSAAIDAYVAQHQITSDGDGHQIFSESKEQSVPDKAIAPVF